MKVRDLMIKKVITVQQDASVYDAVKLLNKNKIGCLVVVYNDDIVGILTERDLLERVLEKCRNPKEIEISEIMTKTLILGRPDMEVFEATKLMMENKVKKLPIIKEHRLVGIITVTDIAQIANIDKDTIELVDTLSNMRMLK